MVGSPSSSSSSPLSSLLCQEDKPCLIEEEDAPILNQLIYSQPLIPCSDLGYEDDYIKFLVHKEKDYNFGSNRSRTTPSRLIDARLDAINWVLHTQTLLGLRNQTAYLSVTYFDRSLTIIRIDEDNFWAIRLLSLACLCLAVKMGETKQVSLSEYSTKEGYSFRDQEIQKMEVLVLNALEWNMRFITPFPYLCYCSNKLAAQGTKLDQLISRAVELLMAIMKEINVMDYRPSMVATAAVLAATDWQLTQEALKSKINAVSLLDWGTSENEQLSACYSIMQRLCAQGNPSTPNTGEVDQKPSANTTSVGGSMRRLSFSDPDEDPGSGEKIQHR